MYLLGEHLYFYIQIVVAILSATLHITWQLR